MRGRYPTGGGTTPPAPWMGSAMKAAMLPAPMSRIAPPSRLVGAIDKGVRVAELHHLIGDDLAHLLAPIADVHAPQPADPVEIAPSGRIPHVGALGLADHQRAVALERVEVRPRMQKVG